jgi:tetratricopeptide (TPR) repeat protein
MNTNLYKFLSKIIPSLLFIFFVFTNLSPNELQEAYTLRYQGKYEEAIKKVKSSKFLGDTESEILLAKLYLDTGAFQDAIQLYSRLCKTINTHECYNEFGISYMEFRSGESQCTAIYSTTLRGTLKQILKTIRRFPTFI